MGVNGIYGLSGSGLDVESMVKVGMLSKQSEYEKMQQKFTKNEWKKSEYLEVYSEIQTFNSSTISKYKMSSNMDARSATSANTSVVTATANANAAPMTHYVKVDSLASSAYLIGTEMNRVNNKASDKNLLSSVLYSSIAAGSTEGMVSLDGTDNAVAATATALTFSINDGVNGLLASANSDAVVATATPDAATGTHTVKITELATGATSKGYVRAGVDENATMYSFFFNNTLSTLKNNTTNTDTAFTFDFNDGTTTASIGFTFEDFGGSVKDFVAKLNEQFENSGLTLEANFVTDTATNGNTGGAISITNTQVGSDSNFTISSNYIASSLSGTAREIANTLFLQNTNRILSTSDTFTKTISNGSNATGSIDGTAFSDLTGATVSGNTVTYNGITYTAKAPTAETNPNGVEITNTGAQNIVVTYQDLLDGFTLNDLTSKINSQGTNIRATYDSVQDRISFYNQKSGEDNQINIEIGTGEGAANAAKFFNALGLKQSANGVLDETAKSFDTDTTVSQAGTNSSVMIDGVSFNLDSNKATVAGVTYTFQNVTTTDNQTTVTITQDTEAIVKQVQSFVDDYNALLEKLYKWYDEKPNSDYKPLTETQKSGMKEEQIEKWEEKAKAGLLYHDQTLSKIISDIRSAVTSNVEGIDSKYKNIFSLGVSTTGLKGQLTLDKDKLNAALAEDSEAVYNVFAKLDANDEFDSNGVAQRLGDIFQKSMKSIKSVSGTTASITEDSELNNLLRELQTKMSNFKRMMDAFESKLYKKYDAMEVALASLGSQLNYVTSAFQ